MPLFSLPNELLILIAEKIDRLRDLYSFFRTHRTLAQLITPYLTQLLYRFAVQNLFNLTPFHWATRRGHQGLVKLLLDQGADVNFHDKAFICETALSHAAECGRENVVRFLLENGAEPNAQADFGFTALHFAAENKFNSAKSGLIVQLLLDKGADHTIAGDRRMTALHVAVVARNKPAVLVLLENGADPNTRDSFNFTPLHRAFGVKSSLPSLEISAMLLKSGASIVTGGHGRTAVHMAASSGIGALVELMQEYGADIFELCDNGDTALHGAVGEEVVRQLIRKGLDPAAENNHMKTALDYVIYARPRCEPEARLLLEAGRNVYTHETLVHTAFWAIQNGYDDIFRNILESGLDISAEDNIGLDGWTALHAAVDSGLEVMVELALRGGFDVSTGRGTPPGTALHEAIKCRSQRMVELLLKKGIDVNTRDMYGRTALDIASQKNGVGDIDEWQCEIIKILCQSGAESSAECDAESEGYD